MAMTARERYSHNDRRANYAVGLLALLIPVVYVGAVMGLERLVRWLGPRWGDAG